jgi:hypothetical protein
MNLQEILDNNPKYLIDTLPSLSSEIKSCVVRNNPSVLLLAEALHGYTNFTCATYNYNEELYVYFYLLARLKLWKPSQYPSQCTFDILVYNLISTTTLAGRAYFEKYGIKYAE